uniref:Galactosylgalactosylxylosylprotein 3-beta-glucuronosyltransferase n=1 Tax=Globodera rostochiensis TaxID=31243 RepID=A0A914HJI3_GLORO
MPRIGRKFLTNIVLVLFSSILLTLFWHHILPGQCGVHNQCYFLKSNGDKLQQLPPIFFVTPSARRPAQKADLTRLGQTLANVANLVWLIVEDSPRPSKFIGQLIERLEIRAVHLTAETPSKWRLKYTDPHWKYPKGVVQRNAALRWLRKNAVDQRVGAVYFGDDDNTYDWRIFDQIRSLRRVGVWPVGIVGGMLAEFAYVNANSVITGFNAKWRTARPFPIDMAAFAVNITLVHDHRHVEFDFNSPRGYLESHFLRDLNLTRADLEPLAQNCTKVFVWHTRTEQVQFRAEEMSKFVDPNAEGLAEAEKDAIF